MGNDFESLTLPQLITAAGNYYDEHWDKYPRDVLQTVANGLTQEYKELLEQGEHIPYAEGYFEEIYGEDTPEYNAQLKKRTKRSCYTGYKLEFGVHGVVMDTFTSKPAMRRCYVYDSSWPLFVLVRLENEYASISEEEEHKAKWLKKIGGIEYRFVCPDDLCIYEDADADDYYDHW